MQYSRFFYKNFFLIIAIYYILQIIIKINYGGVEYDDAEQFLLYQNLSLYYTNAQPPLYNWIQYLFFELFGLNIFALAVFKHLLLFLILFSYYLLGRELGFTKDEAIIISSTLFLLPQIAWGAEFKLTHSVLLLLISILTLIYLIRLIKLPSLKRASILALLIAFGILSKYSYLMLLFAIVIFLFMEYRNLLFSKYSLVVIVVSLALLAPHLFALLSHLSDVLLSIKSKTHKSLGVIHGIISLIKATLAFLAPLLLIYIPIFIKSGYSKEAKNRYLKLLERVVLIIYLLILLAILFGIFDDFKERWFLPYLFVVPLIFASRVKSGIKKYKKIFSYIITLILGLLLTIFALRLLYPDFIYKVKGKYSHDIVDYSYIKNYISKNYTTPKNIYADTLMLGGNIKRVFPNSKVNDFNSNTRADMIIKEDNFKGAFKLKVPYKFSKRYKIYYIKLN